MPAKAKGGGRERGKEWAHSLPFQVSPRRGKGKANPPTKATAAPHPQNPRRGPGGTPPAITGGHSTPLPRAASRRGLTGSPCLAPRPPLASRLIEPAAPRGGGRRAMRRRSAPPPRRAGAASTAPACFLAQAVLETEMHYNAMTLLSDSPYGGFGARPIDVLFPISTGGAMTDLQETIDTIIKASDFPSSILVAGVGGADGNGDNGTGKLLAII
uniref:Copine C-terminal domain-containing protein n=1 Tax=Oryza nivara TaxID=4536 RepID=A0A0E0FVJ5_ORYNI